MEPKTVRRGECGLPARHIAADSADNRLVAGTEVLTLDGTMPVEFLSPGDRVISRDRGAVVLRALRRQRLVLPLVAIRAGTLGNSRPGSDARLPGHQEILVRDWRAAALFGAARALVPVQRLIDGTHIRDLGKVEVESVALVFDQPHIIYADGLELASATAQTAPA